MKLNVYDRIVLLNNLPEQGDITSLRIVRVLREELSLSEEEHKLIELKSDPKTNNISWNPQKDPFKDIEIGERAMEIIRGTVKKFAKFSEERGNMNLQNLELVEKFISTDEINEIIDNVGKEKAEKAEKAEKEKATEENK